MREAPGGARSQTSERPAENVILKKQPHASISDAGMGPSCMRSSRCFLNDVRSGTERSAGCERAPPSASRKRYFFLAGVFLPPFLAAFAFSSSSLPGQSKLGQSFQGPRAVFTTTMGAPQCSHTSSVGMMSPYWGSG
jgi:hypothetical protein